MGTGQVQQRGSAVPSGNTLLQQILAMANALGLYGANSTAYFLVRDASGNPRTYMGALPNGDYGILLDAPNNEDPTELLPLVTQFYGSTISTTIAAFVTNANLPPVTAWIGASGDALIRITSFIQLASAAQVGTVGIEIDGVTPNSQVGQLALVITGSDTNGACSCAIEFSAAAAVGNPLSTGNHTFQLLFRTGVVGQLSQFSFTSMTVQPI